VVNAVAPTRVLVVPELHAGPWPADDEPSRRLRVAAARARFGDANVELPRGERAGETAARLAAAPRCDLWVVGGAQDEPAVAVLLDALREQGLAAHRFEAAEGGSTTSPALPATAAAESRVELLLRALGVDPALALYAGRGVRERNADSLVNLR
jgi:hypothetical protein